MLERLAGNSQVIKKTAKNFINDLQLDTAQLIENIKNHCPERVTEISHKIKGSAITFGCNYLSQLMNEIEMAAKNNHQTNMENYLNDISGRVSMTILAIETKLSKKSQ